MANNILIKPGLATIEFSGSISKNIELRVAANGEVQFVGDVGGLLLSLSETQIQLTKTVTMSDDLLIGYTGTAQGSLHIGRYGVDDGIAIYNGTTHTSKRIWVDNSDGSLNITSGVTKDTGIRLNDDGQGYLGGNRILTTLDSGGESGINAATLDNQPASFYRNASNINAGTLLVTRGGTGQTSLTANKVLVGNGTNGILQPTNLHWDNSSSFLGIGVITPSRSIDIETSTGSLVGIKLNSTALGGIAYSLVTSNNSSIIGGGKFAIWDDVANASRLTITSTGDIGIGVNAPGAKLEVNGAIISGAITSSGTVTGTSFTTTGSSTANEFIGSGASLTGITTTIVSEGTNLYYTTARANSAIDTRVNKTFVDNLGINATHIGGVAANVVARTDVNQTFAQNIVIQGNLTVEGAEFITNTETVAIADNIVLLNSDVTGVPTQDSGLEIERGTSTNVFLLWAEANDRWEFTNNGSIYHPIPVTTTDLTEGTNLYYTTARANSAIDTRVNKTFVDNLGINASTLGGNAVNFYRNAGNLDAGTLINARVAQSNVTQHQAALAIGWSQLNNIPATFTPSSHTHVIGDVTGLQGALDARLSLAGGTMTGRLVLHNAYDVNRAVLNIPLIGTTDPSVFADGDIWHRSNELYARLNGVTRSFIHSGTYSTIAQAEAEAGSATSIRWWTAQRVSQAILAQAWHAGNDGAGTGLDADLLDGLQSTQFLRNDANSSVNSNISLDIGSGNGSVRLHHNSSENRFYIAPFNSSTYQSGQELTYQASDGFWKFKDRLDVLGVFNITGAATFASTLSVSGNPSIGNHVGNRTYNDGRYAQLSTANTFSGNITIASGNNIIFNNGSDKIRFGSSDTWEVFRNSSTEFVLSKASSNGLELRIVSPDNNYLNASMFIGNNKVVTVADYGSGNGIDADMLDGLQATDFLRTTADSTLGNNNWLYIGGAGNGRIGLRYESATNKTTFRPYNASWLAAKDFEFNIVDDSWKFNEDLLVGRNLEVSQVAHVEEEVQTQKVSIDDANDNKKFEIVFNSVSNSLDFNFVGQ